MPKLPLFIAKRYLFTKRSTLAINIISIISGIGIMAGCAFMLVVLSIFNGFEDLLENLFGSFNPEVKISPIEGKVFTLDEEDIYKIKNIPGIKSASQTIEEVAFFEYGKNQTIGIIKGVDANFAEVNAIDSTIVRGEYYLNKSESPEALIGMGMEYKLNVNIGDAFEPLAIYMPKRKKVSFGAKAFDKLFLKPTGVFAIQSDIDGRYVLAPLQTVRDLMKYQNEIGALEIGLVAGTDASMVRAEIEKIIDTDKIKVQTRFEQDEEFFKLMRLEKLLSFVLFTFCLMLFAFNMIGSLWMIVIDKKKDIAVLKSMGASKSSIRNIFINQGLLLAIVGGAAGILLALLFYFLQTNFQLFKLDEMGTMVVDAYPISLRFWDFVYVALVVLVVGFIASWLPAQKAANIPSVARAINN